MKRKILSVSPDPIMIDFLSKNINRANFELALTRLADTGLKDVLDDEKPDVILLDIMMPDLDGIKACLSLRQFTDRPILMISTWGAGDNMVRGLDLSAFSYLTEPFGIAELEVRIEQSLNSEAAALVGGYQQSGT